MKKIASRNCNFCGVAQTKENSNTTTNSKGDRIFRPRCKDCTKLYGVKKELYPKQPKKVVKEVKAPSIKTLTIGMIEVSKDAEAIAREIITEEVKNKIADMYYYRKRATFFATTTILLTIGAGVYFILK